MFNRIAVVFRVPKIPGPFSLLHPLKKGDQWSLAGAERESSHICDYRYELFTISLNYFVSQLSRYYQVRWDLHQGRSRPTISSVGAGSSSECA
jgi:hypothetical protein